MVTYYFLLALASLKRNIVLTSLVVMAIGVGIGTSMTVYTVLSTLSRDPIPEKSSQLFVPQLDNWGPDARSSVDRLQDALTYRDAMALLRSKQVARQTALYGVRFSVTPRSASLRRFSISGHAVHRDFFQMFNVPFSQGMPWSAEDDATRAGVVVIGAKLADKLFANQQPVGQTITLDAREYRVVGVLRHWAPIPRFYDPSITAGMEQEDVFLPFATAIERQVPYQNSSCYDPQATMAPGWEGHLNSECIWIRLWVELENSAAVRGYREFLHNYAAEQRRTGRFRWAPSVDLKGLREWLVFQNVVPNELRVSSLLAFAFLLVCLINSIGLMLAKFSGRASEFGLRRALGASKAAIFWQSLMETAVIGVLGGALGLSLTSCGLRLARALFGGFGSGLAGAPSEDVAAQLTHLDFPLVAITFAVAVFATVCSGLYPAWRVSSAQPAWQLKN